MKIMTFFAVLGLVTGLAIQQSEAKSYTIGDDKPIAVIVIPDSWKTEAIEDGIEATSPDDGVSVIVEAVEIKDVEEATREGIKYFQENGVTLDTASQKQSQTTIGGLPAIDLSWKGKDKDGPTNVGLTFVVLNETDSVLIYFWGDDESTKLNEPALRSIADSLKPVGK